MVREKVRQFDDLSAEITCVVEGYPPAKVHYEFKVSLINLVPNRRSTVIKLPKLP